jgi:hypothetical protein
MRPRRAPKPVTTAELAATTPNSILTHTITLGEELSKDTDGSPRLGTHCVWT